MREARFIRRRRFRALHHYRREEWSEARNADAFGRQTEPHAHDWVLEIRVVGPIDPETGFCADLGALDRTLDEVTAGWDGGDLNALIPEARSGGLVPTTEGLARWAYERIRSSVPAPARLEAVAVFESPDLGAEYPAHRSAP